MHTGGCARARVLCHGDTTPTFVALVKVISYICVIQVVYYLHVLLFELPLFNKHIKLLSASQ